MRKVEKTEGGRYKVRFRHGLNKSGTGKRQASETFATYREAEQFARWLDALGPQGALDRLYEAEQAAGMLSLDAVAADHIKYLTGVTDGYRLTLTRLWARTWGPILGTLPADMLSRDAISEALNALALRYSHKSLKNQRGLLFGVAERCVDKGYLSTNPVRKLRLPKGTADAEDDDTEMVCLTEREYDVLYAAMAPHYRPLLRFLAGTGCRWGEAVALRVRDVDLDGPAPVIRIRRALKWSPDGNRQIGPPKTPKSRRTVWLPIEVADDLERLIRGKAGKDLVFTAPRGGMVAHRTFWSDHWRPAVWRAQHCPEHLDPTCRCGTAHPKRCTIHSTPPPPCGCDGTVRQSPRIHDLRHSHASWLLAAGTPIHVVQARLGHESIQTTVDTYSHLLPDAQLVAAQAASAVFSRTPPAIEP